MDERALLKEFMDVVSDRSQDQFAKMALVIKKTKTLLESKQNPLPPKEFSCPFCGNGFIPKDEMRTVEEKNKKIDLLERRIAHAFHYLKISAEPRGISNRQYVLTNAIKENEEMV